MTINTTKPNSFNYFKAVVGIVAVIGIGFLMLRQQRLVNSFRAENNDLATQIVALRASQNSISNVLSQERLAQALSREQFLELMRLRGEIGSLRLLQKETAVSDAIVPKEQSQAQWAEWVSSVRANGVRMEDAPYLIQALTNEDPSVRLNAVKTLRLIGLEASLNTNLTAAAESQWRQASEPAAPSLVRMLTDPDPFVRANAAITLGFLQVQPGIVVPALAESLADPESRVSQSAAKALGRFRQEAQSAIPNLIRAAVGMDEALQKAALAALQQIAP